VPFSGEEISREAVEVMAMAEIEMGWRLCVLFRVASSAGA
jgi:hypothetical protein